MDIFGGLRKLLGLDGQTEQPVVTSRGGRGVLSNPGQVDTQQPFINQFGSTVVPSLGRSGRTIPTQSNGITGATNVNEQVYRGNIPFSPGEGPRTTFPSFEEIIRQRRR